jgi:hypothetical protein
MCSGKKLIVPKTPVETVAKFVQKQLQMARTDAMIRAIEEGF